MQSLSSPADDDVINTNAMSRCATSTDVIVTSRYYETIQLTTVCDADNESNQSTVD